VPSHDLRRSYRMTDGSSVLAAEMEAIGRAIEWATTANIPHVVVFSDSLGADESLENQRSGSRPRQLTDLMYALYDGGHERARRKNMMYPLMTSVECTA